MKININNKEYKVSVGYDRGFYEEQGCDYPYNHLLIFLKDEEGRIEEITIADDDPDYQWRPEDLIEELSYIQERGI